MSGIFQNGAYVNGFDYPNAVAQIFDFGTGGPASSVTRFGSGQSFNVGNSPAGKNLQTQLATIFEGFAANESNLPTSGWAPLRQWYDSTAGQVQVSLQYGTQGQLQFFQGSGTGTPLGSASPNGIIQVSGWPFLEIKIVFATGTGGSVILKAWGPNGNGSTAVISSSSLNTAPSGNAFTDRVYFETNGIGSNETYIDDWYMLDNTGASPLNTFLGNGRIQTDAPTSDATPNQFASSNSEPTGSHYKDVNQLPFSSDANYLYDNNVGDEELFGFPNLTASQVLLINEIIRTELDAAGTRTIETLLESGAATQNGTAFQPSTAFAFFNTLSATDPNTSNPWASGTVAAAQSAKLGVKIAS